MFSFVALIFLVKAVLLSYSPYMTIPGFWKDTGPMQMQIYFLLDLYQALKAKCIILQSTILQKCDSCFMFSHDVRTVKFFSKYVGIFANPH